MLGILILLLDSLGLSPLPMLARLIGTTAPALTLLISIIMGYPLGYIYNKHVRKYFQYKHYFFILTGIDMAICNFGLSMYHNMLPVLVMYLTTKIIGPGKNHTTINFVFNMVYLLVGYVVTESEDYDITWTMPHCVLTLKMIALSYDLWDGVLMKQGKQLSISNKDTAVLQAPTLVELFGFVYFPACFLVGPIFSFRRYDNFVNEKFPVDRDSGVLEKEAIKRLVQGLLYLIAFQIGVSIFSMKYMQSEDFWNDSILYRHIHCGMWAHFALYKYISCWLLTEAACIRFGLSYNGEKKISEDRSISKWDGCNNIKLLRFETATKFQHYIDSFNCNTNHFAAQYIYKRLKFLGNRSLSQLLTLLFLALWHGTGSGYYVTFFNEFIIIHMEKEAGKMIAGTRLYESVCSSLAGRIALYGSLKAYTIIFMGWSLVPFDLKAFSKWWPVYASLYFSGFIVFVPWDFVYKPLLLKFTKTTSDRHLH